VNAAASLVATELRLQYRHGAMGMSAVLAAAWIVVLRSVPAAARPGLLPWVLFLDLATLGFFIVPALAVIERGNGVTAALALTRARPITAIAVRLGVLAATALAAAAAVTPAASVGWPATVLVGAVLTALLLSLVAAAMLGRSTNLTEYVGRAPLVAVPLLVPPLVRGVGLADHPALALSPATVVFDVLRGEVSAPGVAWLALCIVALLVVVTRIGFVVGPAEVRATRRARSGRATVSVAPTRPRNRARSHGPLTPAGSFARIDVRTLVGDRVLVPLLLGVPLIAATVRWLQGPGAPWLEDRLGVALVPYLPAIVGFVMAVHVPVTLGAVVGLLFLEDRDAGVLPAVAVTRAGLTTLVVYRLTAAVVVGAVGVLAGVAIGGVSTSGIGGVVALAAAGGAVATVPATLLATVARDRVQGMALLKVIAVPLYAPVAWWFVDGTRGWVFGLSPTGWALQTAWAATDGGAAVAALVCVGLTGALVGVLVPRLRRSLVV